MSQDQKSNNADAAGLDDVITEEIHLLRRLLKAQQFRFYSYSDTPRDMVYMGVRMLDYIGGHPGCTQSDLVGHFFRDRAQVAKLVGGLRERGLVDTEVDENDRRLQRLHITEEGRKIRVGAQRERKRVARLALTGIDAADRKQLIELLRRIRRNLEEG